MNKERIDYWNEIINSGDIYDCTDSELMNYQNELVDKLRKYNLTPETKEGIKAREEMLKDMCGTYGESLTILPPVYANFGLKHVHFGKRVYLNFGVTLVDDAFIYIGDYTKIGPNVSIITACHPISPRLRNKGLQYNKQVHIGKNVWLGANSIILPGVTIGDNSIVGAGSVVTKDIPSDVIVVGNPARILRKIDDNDDVYSDKKKISKGIIDKYLN